MLVQDPHIDLQVSSTYYRNTHDAAIVPSVIDEHARGHGFYGHPPIDPRTGKPYDYTEEEHFRIKLRPVTESIANQLVIGTATVRNHVQHILDKLGVHSRLEAVTYAREQRLID